MELFGIPFTTIGDVGATALVTLFVLALLTGRLRPQRAIEEVRADRDARIAEAREQYVKALEIAKIWEEAFRANQASTTELRATFREQVELMKPLPALMQGLLAVAKRLDAQQGGSDDDQ